MADNENESRDRSPANSGIATSNTGYAACGENHLNSNDHRILERAIRGSVSSIVGASHPDIVSLHDRSPPSDDPEFRLHPELHPLARQMPGAERAVDFREPLLACLVHPDPRHHRAVMDELLRSSVPIQTLAVHLFAPVATRLGDLWCSDEADFMQVAVASTRLRMIVNHVSYAAHSSQAEQPERRGVLLACTRGAAHTLGVTIIASCFRDMGWDVEGGSDLEIGDDLYARLARRPYKLLGISVGRMDDIAECTQAIDRVQSTPRLRATKIALGGPAVVAAPKIFQRIGAHFVTCSALDVVQLASSV
ncbi:B12-binding domain-containing protein [Rhizobium sp. TRM95796]|uniref:cobalamin B12-binding domain-containing protein n=1 Tax=Rhizobium sp. TRM95796 TaxID=2979862 RepID=UPI0021E6DB72|nr:cobalamin B12-binding domain-containing protein [Rhizobium sp. TRM95796]MCV3768065.1 cobalamin B12-binding domain-containing protein [Rhizobium sp. TRM95796]